MTHRVTTTSEVRDDHTLVIRLPDEIPPGPVTITATVTSKEPANKLTAAELAVSEFAGMWADRRDLPSSNEEFIEWRRTLWERTA